MLIEYSNQFYLHLNVSRYSDSQLQVAKNNLYLINNLKQWSCHSFLLPLNALLYINFIFSPTNICV